MIQDRKSLKSEQFLLESDNLLQKELPLKPLPDKDHEQIRLSKHGVSAKVNDLFRRVQDFNGDLHKKSETEAVRETALKGLQSSAARMSDD